MTIQAEINEEVIRHIENFAKELKEGIERIKTSEFGESMANIILDYIDGRLAIYEKYFDIYQRELERNYKNGRK